MKKTPQIVIVCSVLLFSILACTLPGNVVSTQEFPPTPNATMTELYALATILTPADTEISENTSTPVTVDTETTTFTSTVTSTIEEIEEATATLKPTKTFTPLPTFTLAPQERSGDLIRAEYLSDAPDIDGDWGEWDTTQYDASIVVYGSDKWADHDDLQAAYRIGWDEDRLYVAVKVRDNIYVQNATGANLYKGDSIELLLDTDLYGDYYVAHLNSDDFQLGISPGRGDPGDDMEAYLWFPSDRAGTKSKVKIAATGGDGVYRVEFSIPWSIFDIEPSFGDHFGFAISVSDNDNSSANVQQTMISSASRRLLVDPTTWGEIKLVN